MEAISDANRKLISLGWKIKDGEATREDAINIALELDNAFMANSVDNLTEMEELKING